MDIRQLTSAEDLASYKTWITAHPQGNLWQSPEWKKYQETLGRGTRLYAAMDDKIVASALVVIDRTTGGFSTWDIPRGPLGPHGMENGKRKTENIMSKILQDAKKDKCLSLYFSPIQSFSTFNFQFPIRASARHEQPEATRVVDLAAADEEILKQMHQKGRYNIKVAEKAGVMVRESTDIDAYAALAKKTAGRDGFTAASTKTYRTFLETLPGAFLLLAYTSDISSPIAGLIGVTYGQTGVYYYGASDYEHRSLMAPYLLQWEAMKRCKSAGCTQYDLLGIAPPDANPAHQWAGISDFKAKFGGTVITYPPEQEIVLRPVMRGVLKMKRKIVG